MDEERCLDVLRDIAQGFDTHDLDRIMSHFADDAVFDGPRGADAWASDSSVATRCARPSLPGSQGSQTSATPMTTTSWPAIAQPPSGP